jgi:hypothetical protein
LHTSTVDIRCPTYALRAFPVIDDLNLVSCNPIGVKLETLAHVDAIPPKEAAPCISTATLMEMDTHLDISCVLVILLISVD